MKKIKFGKKHFSLLALLGGLALIFKKKKAQPKMFEIDGAIKDEKTEE